MEFTVSGNAMVAIMIVSFLMAIILNNVGFAALALSLTIIGKDWRKWWD